MADIIDFNSKKQQDNTIRDLASMLGAEMPNNGLFEQVSEAIGDKMTRLALLYQIAKEACALIEAAGLDPNGFDLDDDALDAFFTAEIEEADLEQLPPELLWNGPRLWCEGQGYEVRVASTVVIAGEENTAYAIDILKLEEGADHWLCWTEGKWQAGPPEDAFEYVDALRHDMLDGDDDGECDWFDDEDEEWDASVESMVLPQNVINTLIKAGINKIEDLKHMTDAQLLAIKGIGKKALADIHEALEYED